MPSNKAIPYRYRHMPIGGGGYVTGFYFHPTDPHVMYCRTDIGGMYRFGHPSPQGRVLARPTCTATMTSRNGSA